MVVSRPSGNPDNWPYVRINSANDGQVAQAATTFHLAKLFSLIADGTLVDSASSGLMKALLQGGSWFDGGTDAFSARTFASNGPLRVTASKVGRGPLKRMGEVFSEGALFHEDAHDADFAVAWQNLKGPGSQAKIKSVATVIENTIKNTFRP